MSERTPEFRPLRQGTALVLAGSGLFYLALCLWFDGHEIAAGQRIEGPGSYALGMMFVGIVCPLLALAVWSGTFLLCLIRNDRPLLGIATAMAALVFLAVALGSWVSDTKLRYLSLVFPAPLLGQLLGTLGWIVGKLGWYVGIATQFAAAVWLWGRRGGNNATNPPVLPNSNASGENEALL
jgi:hypothetical protein